MAIVMITSVDFHIVGSQPGQGSLMIFTRYTHKARWVMEMTLWETGMHSGHKLYSTFCRAPNGQWIHCCNWSDVSEEWETGARTTSIDLLHQIVWVKMKRWH